jgi:hypothetical protein
MALPAAVQDEHAVSGGQGFFEVKDGKTKST